MGIGGSFGEIVRQQGSSRQHKVWVRESLPSTQAIKMGSVSTRQDDLGARVDLLEVLGGAFDGQAQCPGNSGLQRG